jgi:hypothetical protein
MHARWSLDFVHDQFSQVQRFRMLNVVDVVPSNCEDTATVTPRRARL